MFFCGGFSIFFNTLCGEMMPRIEWMYWYSTVRHLLNSSPIFSDVRDEAPSMMRETKERSPNDNWEWQLFVLLISLAMRFVVLYTWFKEKCPQSSLIVKKWTTYTIWVAFGFTFIGNPEEINPFFQLQQLMRRHQFFFFAGVDGEQSSFPQQHLSAAIDQETRPPRRPPPPPSPPPVLGCFILGCRRMTDCRTENRSETLESPGPEGDLGIGLPLAAPWAAPARPPGSSRGRWVCASFPGGSCPIGRGRAGCLDQPPGWRRGRWPSCSERKQKGGKHLRSCAVVLCNAFRWHQKSGLQDSSNCKFLIFSWWIICKGRMWLCVFFTLCKM